MAKVGSSLICEELERNQHLCHKGQKRWYHSWFVVINRHEGGKQRGFEGGRQRGFKDKNRKLSFPQIEEELVTGHPMLYVIKETITTFTHIP